MKKYTEDELAIIWLNSFTGLEYKHKSEIFKVIRNKTEIKKVILSEKERIENMIGAEKFNTLLSASNKTYLDFVLSELESKGIIAVTIESGDYPDVLKEITCPPLVLYAKGNVKLLKTDSFAIVGSRKSLPFSVAIASEFARAISAAGLTLVTGIAEGVDLSVIKAALEKGKPIISVTAGGFDHIYPAANSEAFGEVAKSGLVISEYPPDIVARPYFFPVRNRIIAGLSKGTLVVSAGMKSGTMYTAEYAEEFGKDLFAVPYSPNIESGAGCNDLIKRGAYLADSPDDILKFYKLGGVSENLSLTDEEKKITEILKEGNVHAEKIAERLGKKVFEITPLLSMLEIKGIIVKSGINVYGLIRKDSEA